MRGEALLIHTDTNNMHPLLYTQAGLVNGAMGTVKEIVWSAETTRTSLPEFVVVDFPGYRGSPFPMWADDENKRTWVPIPSVRNRVEDGDKEAEKRGTVFVDHT